jgi:hypothetical protein
LHKEGNVMKKLASLTALALLLSFGTATLVVAGDPPPAPAPTDGKDKKDDKGGKGGK